MLGSARVSAWDAVNPANDASVESVDVGAQVCHLGGERFTRYLGSHGLVPPG
jgi:hypothetical protein